jgi:hypothetical protein
MSNFARLKRQVLTSRIARDGIKMEDMSKLKDEITELTLEELVSRVKVFLTLEPELCMQTGFCASTRERFEQVADYIAKTMGIPAERVLSYDIQKDHNIVDSLKEVQRDTIIKSPILIKITSFITKGERRMLIPHRYGQTLYQKVRQDMIPENLPNPKKMLALTHIDREADHDMYEEAVRGALNSQFKMFVYEFK